MANRAGTALFGHAMCGQAQIFSISRPYLLCCWMTDITLKPTDPSRQGSDFWRQVLDSLTAEVAVMDRSGTIVAVNNAWTRFSADNGGSTRQTGVGANYLDVCRRIEGEDSHLAMQACRGIEQVLEGVRQVFDLEYPCHSSSEKRWFLLHVSPLKAEEDYVVTTHLPITDRKVAEQRLVVAGRLAAIGEAMQGLSHEGRNALQRAQAGMDLLRFHIAEDAEALELLGRIESAQHHLLRLYEEVKSYAAPITLSREPYALDQLVKEVWDSFASRAPQARFLNESRFLHLPEGRTPTCEIDVSAIRQVLQLVLENSLATGTDALEIEVTYVEDQLDGLPAVTIIVSDNGPGIRPEDWERVFEPFYTTKQRGTGLGLAVCRRIISAHRGRICFASPRKAGASLFITLPVHQRLSPD